MRLWHKDLIPVLPKNQLIAQWRECIAIIGNINKYGNPHHILVNPIMNYTKSHFYSYCCMICKEMLDRGYKVSEDSKNKVINFCTEEEVQKSSRIEKDNSLFYGWHSDRYLLQCYYNLQEKHDRGSISDSEWHMIYLRVSRMLDGKVLE